MDKRGRSRRKAAKAERIADWIDTVSHHRTNQYPPDIPIYPRSASAALRLGELGKAAQAAIPALEEAMLHAESHTVRGAAAKALSHMGKAVQSIAESLCHALRHDEDFVVRKHAAMALGWSQANAMPVDQALLQALEDNDEYVQLEALVALRRRYIYPPCRQELLADIYRRNLYLRPTILREFPRQKLQAENAAQLVLEALREAQDPLILTAAASAMRHMAIADDHQEGISALLRAWQAGPEAIQASTSHHKERTWERVRLNILHELARHGASAMAAKPLILEALSDDAHKVRTAAIVAAGSFGEQGDCFLPLLHERLQERHIPLRDAARKALHQIAPEVNAPT